MDQTITTTGQRRQNHQHRRPAPGPERADRLARLATRHRALLGVVAAYLATLLFVPVAAPIALNDDWIYTRSVEILLDEGRLQILDIAAADALFQILWAAPFAWVTGPVLSVFAGVRLATVAFAGLAGLATYGLCRELGVRRPDAALGVALVLFNPLALSLNYSFMTDGYFAGLVVIATYFLVRGVGRSPTEPLALIAGSVVIALATMQRTHGLLLPAAFAGWAAFGFLARRRRVGLYDAVLVAGPALALIAGYQWWRYTTHPRTMSQEIFLEAARTATLADLRLLVARLSYILLAYAGFFVLPVAAAALACVPRLVSRSHPLGRVAFAVSVGVLATGAWFFAQDGRHMPYLPQFFSSHGLSAEDLIVPRPPFLPHWGFVAFTAACIVAAVVAAAAMASRGSTPPRPRSPSARALVVWILALQVAGVVATSLMWRDGTVFGRSAPSLDRYLMPLLPLVVCLVLVGLRDAPFRRPVAWALAVAIGLVSVIGTRDGLNYNRLQWELAESVVEAGVDRTRIDGGGGWVGYHLWELSYEAGVPAQTPDPTWWMGFWGPISDSTFVVSHGPVSGYEVIERRAYDRWLGTGPAQLYLLRRLDDPAGDPDASEVQPP